MSTELVLIFLTNFIRISDIKDVIVRVDNKNYAILKTKIHEDYIPGNDKNIGVIHVDRTMYNAKAACYPPRDMKLNEQKGVVLGKVDERLPVKVQSKMVIQLV